MKALCWRKWLRDNSFFLLLETLNYMNKYEISIFARSLWIHSLDKWKTEKIRYICLNDLSNSMTNQWWWFFSKCSNYSRLSGIGLVDFMTLAKRSTFSLCAFFQLQSSIADQELSAIGREMGSQSLETFALRYLGLDGDQIQTISDSRRDNRDSGTMEKSELWTKCQSGRYGSCSQLSQLLLQ